MNRTLLYQCALLILTFTLGQTADCPGIEGHLNGENIENFVGCSKVMGNVVINQVSFQRDTAGTNSANPLTTDQLEQVLSDVVEVDGYVQIEDTNHEELTNLRFLRNLETIYGHETLEVFPNHHYSLIISDNDYLQTLNLASLKKIENGGVRIVSNPRLCLIDTITVEDYLIGSSLSRVGGYAQDCSGVSCHNQCEMTRGCWGTLADECVQCRSYSYQGTCVEACDENISYTDDETMSCIPLPNSPTDSTRANHTHQPSSTPLLSPTHSTNNDTANSNEANVSTVVQMDTTASPATEKTADTKVPQWVAPFVGVSFILLISLIAGIALIAYAQTRCKKSKSLTRTDQNCGSVRDTKVIQVINDGRTSHLQHTVSTLSLGEGSLIRRQQTVPSSNMSTDDTCSHMNGAPEPVVVLMMPESANETLYKEDDYTTTPYEHDYQKSQDQMILSLDGHMTPSQNDHMTLSHDCHMTNSESLVDDSIDSQPLYESVSSTTGYESALTRSNGSNTSKQTVSSQSAVIKPHSHNRNSRSSFQHSMGAVYSTRQSSSHTHYSSISNRNSSTSLSQRTSGRSQRASGRGSSVSHRLPTTGGSIVSRTTTGTSTRDSVNSIMTLHE